MDYAEVREWEEYFLYEPTAADRMETQMALLMQMISGYMWKKPGKAKDFMVCYKKRPEVVDSSPVEKVKDLWDKITSALGVHR